eukprot:294498-Hanusia_phi.AAC.1
MIGRREGTRGRQGSMVVEGGGVNGGKERREEEEDLGLVGNALLKFGNLSIKVDHSLQDHVKLQEE